MKDRTIEFDRDAYLGWSATGVMDGSGTAQTFGPTNMGCRFPGGIPDPAFYFIEPSAHHQGTAAKMPSLDETSRMMLLAARAGGAGAWTAEVFLDRIPQGDSVELAGGPFTIPDRAGGLAVEPVFVDFPIPEGAFRNPAGAAASDLGAGRIVVTPGDTTAAPVFFAVYLYAGEMVARRGRGNAVSGPRWGGGR